MSLQLWLKAVQKSEAEALEMIAHLEEVLRSVKRKRHGDSSDSDSDQPREGNGHTIILPGSTNPGWDQIAPPSNPDYTTGGEEGGG